MRSYASAEINTHVCLCVHPGYMWFCRQTHSPQHPPLLSPELLPETQHRAQWWEWKGQRCPSWRAGEGQVGKSARARSIIAADSRQGAWPAKDKREGRVCAGQEGSHRADAWAAPPGIWAGPWIEVPRGKRGARSILPGRMTLGKGEWQARDWPRGLSAIGWEGHVDRRALTEERLKGRPGGLPGPWLTLKGRVAGAQGPRLCASCQGKADPGCLD